MISISKTLKNNLQSKSSREKRLELRYSMTVNAIKTVKDKWLIRNIVIPLIWGQFYGHPGSLTLIEGANKR